MTLSDLTTDERALQLRAALGDRIILADDPDYDAARVPWNLAIDQRPFAVVRPETAEDVHGGGRGRPWRPDCASRRSPRDTPPARWPARPVGRPCW